MFHAITTALARLVARARDYRLRQDLDMAALRGWEVTWVAPGTCRFRDPRFDGRKALARLQAGDR